MKWRLLAVCIPLLASSVAAVAQPRHQGDASGIPPLLMRVLKLAPGQRYSGIRTVELKVGPDRLRHTEYVIRDGARTRIEFPSDGPYHGQIIVEDGQERRHFMPDKNEVRIMPPRREEAYERLARMVRRPNFKVGFQFTPGDVVAGMRTQLLTISDPRGGIMQRIWIEPRSAMMLKRELYDRTGNLQGFFEFTKIDLSPNIHPSDFVLHPAGARIVTPRDTLRTLVVKDGFLDVSLPPNDVYKLEDARLQKFDGSPVLMQVYSSPQGRFTLFQVRSIIDPAKLHRVKGEFKTVSWQKNGSSFVIIGDLPEDKLRQIAQRLGA